MIVHKASCKCPNCLAERGLRRIYPEMGTLRVDAAREVCWFSVQEHRQTAICCADLHTLRNRRCGEVEGIVECIAPSPCGQRIAFSAVGRVPGVYVLYVDNGKVARLTRGKTDLVDAWQDDGRALEFVRRCSGGYRHFRSVPVPANAERVRHLGPRAVSYTIDDLFAITEWDPKMEIVRGDIVPIRPVRRTHRPAVERLIASLEWYAESSRGRAFRSEFDMPGFVLSRKPDTIRFPLASYVRDRRFGRGSLGDYVGAPDLVIDTVRRGETNDDVYQRMDDYFSAGCSMVWWIDVRERSVGVHRADGYIHAWEREDVLEEPRLLPGFRCPVAGLFEHKRRADVEGELVLF